MKRILALLCSAIAPAFAVDPIPHDDLFRLGFAPPEAVSFHLDDLGLSAEQRERLTATLEDSRIGMPDLQAAAKRCEQELEELVGSGIPPLEDAEASLNRLLDAEGAVKRLQLRTILGVNGILTTGQRAQVIEWAKRDRELEAAFKSKAERFKTTFDSLGLKPTQALEERGQSITQLVDAGKFEAALAELETAAVEVGIDDPETVVLIDFSQFDPGATDLPTLERRYEDVERRVQKVIKLATLRQLIQAHDDLETAKAAEDVITFGRILTWAEGALP